VTHQIMVLGPGASGAGTVRNTLLAVDEFGLDAGHEGRRHSEMIRRQVPVTRYDRRRGR
jgi:hypothetical protein